MAYCGPRGIPLHEFLEWPQGSQDAALSWQAIETSRCSDCRTHREDWSDRAEPQHWAEEVCPGCQRKQRAAAALTKDADGTRGVVLVAHNGPAATCPSCTP